MEPTSLFSAVEGQTRLSSAASPTPATNPFQAPDFAPEFEEDEIFPLEDMTEQPASSRRPARRRAA
ncbi:hypothetical protein C1J00_19120 [Streptomyces cahuitamycinicus]|uniref:Uncharacterized protein n=1 Tax=Streptomyces cahuitamycinicus TaxID=2070367 RepID=A0A2N8TNV1_9ACTN|nr:hypothetical protein C1J00_19120 [Streptomyces cahuitamycinicus]